MALRCCGSDGIAAVVVHDTDAQISIAVSDPTRVGLAASLYESFIGAREWAMSAVAR